MGIIPSSDFENRVERRVCRRQTRTRIGQQGAISLKPLIMYLLQSNLLRTLCPVKGMSNRIITKTDQLPATKESIDKAILVLEYMSAGI